jgi:uncharacterized membrane protein
VNKFWQFVKTTLIGGFLFLAPLIIATYVLAKGLSAVETALRPVEQLLPAKTLYGVAAYDVIATLVLVAIAFGAGVVAGPGSASASPSRVKRSSCDGCRDTVCSKA